MNPRERPLLWLHGEIKTPPFSKAARIEAGYLLRRLQQGDSLAMPHSRPLPAVGERCHELRVRDEGANWRILYRTEPDAVVILEVFEKRTRATPRRVFENCRRRLRQYEIAAKGGRP